MADECRTYDIDGEPITVRSAEPLTPEGLRALAAITAAARQHLAENPPPIRSRPRLVVGGRHASRIVTVATCPDHGVVGPERAARAACWEDCRTHDAEHHPEGENE